MNTVGKLHVDIEGVCNVNIIKTLVVSIQCFEFLCENVKMSKKFIPEMHEKCRVLFILKMRRVKISISSVKILYLKT